jgi:hypothetical protein
VIVGERWETGFWFRLWPGGPGVLGKTDAERPLFSERNGYVRYWRLWPGWRFRFFWA